MSKLSKAEFKQHTKNIANEYQIDNFDAEANSWFEMWANKNSNFQVEGRNGMIDLLHHTDLFPSVKQAILIALTLPVTTCTVERSFSTMRRVKTWLRSTMADERLSGLCMMSVHRDRINDSKKRKIFMDKVINKFGQDHRRLQFLFKD